MTPEERRDLADAVEAFDRVVTPFAPHERSESSRRRYVDDVVEAYSLDIELTTELVLD